jgi:hypothetical protein
MNPKLEYSNPNLKRGAPIVEPMEKCENSVGFLRQDLQEALSKSTPTEGMILLEMIERVAKLEINIKRLRSAIGK